MYKRENPAQQQRNGQHDEKVAHVNARGVGRKVDGKEGQNRYQRRTQQRHGGFATDGRQGFAARFARLEVDQDAVDDDDGVVDQHTHRQDECTQRDALHRAVGETQHKERPDDDDDQAETDNQSAAEAHRQHENSHDNSDRFEQIDQKGHQRIGDTLRLIEDFVVFDARRKTGLLQFGQFALHFGTHFHDVAARCCGDGDAQRIATVVEQFVAHGFGIAAFDRGDIANRSWSSSWP